MRFENSKLDKRQKKIKKKITTKIIDKSTEIMVHTKKLFDLGEIAEMKPNETPKRQKNSVRPNKYWFVF